MPTFFRSMAALGVALSMALVPTLAEAAAGRATTVANVRSGPGLGYAVIAKLQVDEYVVVVDCGKNWCEIKRPGKNGWVSRKLLYNPYYFSEGDNYYRFAPKDDAPGRDSNR